MSRTATGGDMVSTGFATPEVHAEVVLALVKHQSKLSIVTNDDNYALAA